MVCHTEEFLFPKPPVHPSPGACLRLLIHKKKYVIRRRFSYRTFAGSAGAAAAASAAAGAAAGAAASAAATAGVSVAAASSGCDVTMETKKHNESFARTGQLSTAARTGKVVDQGGSFVIRMRRERKRLNTKTHHSAGGNCHSSAVSTRGQAPRYCRRDVERLSGG